jgi:hypothetical protein
VLSRWEGLTRFIDDGRTELDNNASGSAIAQLPTQDGQRV